MTQPVKRSEVCPDARGLFDRIDPAPDVRKRFPVASDENMVRRLWVMLENVPCLIVQGDFLTDTALGISDRDEASIKINIGPFQLEQLPAPHAGKQGHAHDVCRLDVCRFGYGFQEAFQLIRRQVLCRAIVHLHGVNGERQLPAKLPFRSESNDPLH